MKDWPKQAVKWSRKAVPEVITELHEAGEGPESLFDRLSERWKVEMVGTHEVAPTVTAEDGDDGPKPKPKRVRRK